MICRNNKRVAGVRVDIMKKLHIIFSNFSTIFDAVSEGTGYIVLDFVHTFRMGMCNIDKYTFISYISHIVCFYVA